MWMSRKNSCPSWNSLQMEECNTSNYKTRVVKILEQFQSVPGQFYWTLGDGTRIPAMGANNPMFSTVYPFPRHDRAPTICPITWGYDGSGVDFDPISASLFEEMLKMSGFIK